MKELKYNSVGKSLRSKLIKNGCRIRGERLFFDLLRELKKRGEKDPINFVTESIDNISPKVTVISKKVGGSRYQIPVPIKADKEYGIGVSWLVNSLKSVKSGNLLTNLGKEIDMAKRKEGEVIKKRNALHKVAITNIAFLKFLG